MAITIIDKLESSMEHARLQARKLCVLNHKHPLLELLHCEERKESTKQTQDNWNELMRLAHARFPEKELNILNLNDHILLWDEISILLMEATEVEVSRMEEERRAQKKGASCGGNQIAA